MNGHMAGVGDKPTADSFEHGVQVIDGDKEFKLVTSSSVSRSSTPYMP
jgi:hypothetical protein